MDSESAKLRQIVIAENAKRQQAAKEAAEKTAAIEEKIMNRHFDYCVESVLTVIDDQVKSGHNSGQIDLVDTCGGFIVNQQFTHFTGAYPLEKVHQKVNDATSKWENNGGINVYAQGRLGDKTLISWSLEKPLVVVPPVQNPSEFLRQTVSKWTSVQNPSDFLRQTVSKWTSKN